ncbi:LIC_13387 family protein [Dyadobacter fermentans]|uniref:Uncharacterized protein n=1 Tax=Dyadobacter fermentans (strain ATCC 700827 / DSM 18053 / CIP 107007 / KCTC 52180 / NS114) TaxID=471854 RepID=C6VY06_DYAFD|nr:hypothetical protein [Dyadobacter fermentans]ACT96907.1 conserved hypothetical protein [Dyadobacter fermentans DSM 18053]
MKPKLVLRLAALCIAVHLIGHFFGHFSWKETPDPVKQEVIRQMTGPEFEFMGVMRSMGDYFEGYGLILFVVYGMSIALILSAARYSDSYHDIARKVLTPIGIGYVAMGAIEFVYFFPFAGFISLAAGALIILAIFLNG